MESKIKKAAVLFILINAVLRIFFLCSPFMSDIMPFEVQVLNNVSWADFYKDAFFIKLLSFVTDSMFLLRGFKFILSLFFLWMLFDVLSVYFQKNTACLWGYLFFAVPPAFFSYQSVIINDSMHLLWIYVLLMLKFTYPVVYGDKDRCPLLLKCAIFASLFIMAGLFVAYGSFSFFYMGVKHFFAESLPSMFGYFFSFRDYQPVDRVLIFIKGLYVYFLVFFFWQSVFKNKNALCFFKGKFEQTNKTEFFFVLFLLFALLVITGGNTMVVKEISYGLLYIAFAGMFCFFMQDVFSETKIFAVILVSIVMVLGALDNVYLLKRAYAVKNYGSAEKTANQIKSMNISTVFADNDVWLPVSFYLNKINIKHLVLEDAEDMLPVLSKDASILIHADRGVFSPRKIRHKQKKCDWETETVIGKYYIFS